MVLHIFPVSMLHHIGVILFHFIWQATAISLLLALALYGLKISSPHKRYALCCIGMVLMIALPIVTADLFNDRLLHLTTEATHAQTDTKLDEQTYRHSQTLFTKQYRKEPLPVTWQEHIPLWIEAVIPYLTLMWMAGLVFMIIRHLLALRCLSHIIQYRSDRIEDRWIRRMRSLADYVGINRTIRFLKSRRIDAPMVAGWIRPVVLVPFYLFTDMRSDQLEALILHELAHIRRHDHLVNLLQIILETLGFFHPSIWWLSRQIREERELCTDALTLQLCTDRMTYAKSLFSLEQLRHRIPQYALGADGGNLQNRIMRILGQPGRVDRKSWILLICGPLICISCLLIPSETMLLPLQKTRLNTGLCAYFRLDGNGHELTRHDCMIKVYGAHATMDRHGVSNGALAFDGKDDYIEINGMDAIDGHSQLTISAWVQPESYNNFASWISRAHPNMERSQWRLGYGNGSRSSSRNETWGLTEYVETPDSMLWHDIWVIKEEIPLDEWSLITAVIDHDAGLLHLYKNGRKVCEIDKIVPFAHSDAPLYIGRQLDNNSFYKGKIDDVRIYRRALNPLEVKALYKQT